MKKLIRNLTFLSAVVLIAAACQKNETSEGGNDPASEQANATIILNSPTSYATVGGTDDENKITSLEFYIFEDDGTPDAKRSYYKPLTMSTTISFNVSAGLDKKFVVVANMNLGDLTALGAADYDEFRKELATRTLDHTNSRELAAGEFMMSGETTADVIADRTDNRVPISIARLVSKIECPTVSTGIQIQLPDQKIEELWGVGGITNGDISFQFDGFAIVNGLDNSSAIFTGNDEGDDLQPWDTWSWDGKAYHESDFDAQGDFTSVYSGFKTGTDWVLGASDVVYVYENFPVEDDDEGMPGFTKKSVYAAIIKGTLKVASDPTADKVRYWRVNYIKEDNYTIFRNCVYRADISAITTIGYNTPEEAEEDGDNGPNIPDNKQTGVIIELNILDWGLKLFSTQL